MLNEVICIATLHLIELEVLLIKLIVSNHLDAVFKSDLRLHIVLSQAALDHSELLNNFGSDTDYLHLAWVSEGFARDVGMLRLHFAL